MSTKAFATLAALLFAGLGHAAAAEPALTPDRVVEPHGIVSDHDPAVRIGLPEAAVYVGAVRWPLYDVADAELHAFVEADATGLVERFYWIQFEAYFPSLPSRAYDYPASNPEMTTLGDFAVHVRPGFGGGPDHVSRPGSDGEAFRALLAEHGYRLPMWTAQVRFVHLPTPDRRKELMVIYGENLDAVGLDMAGAMQRGADGIAWSELYAPLIERGRAAITLEPIAAD